MTVPNDSQEKLERQRKHFNSIAESYRVARMGRNHLYLKDLIWTEMLKDLSEFKGRRLKVLEPMCGYAHGLDVLEKHLSHDIDYLGYDYSDDVINKLKQQRPGLNVFHADATTYEAPAGEFDIVIIIGGLHHVPDYAASIVAKSVRALRPGGLFINFEPTHGNGIAGMVRDRIYKSNDLFDEQTERAFAVGQLISLFRANGLDPIRIRYPGLLSYILYYNPDAFPALNVGGTAMVGATFALDKLFYASPIGKWFSFATASVWQLPKTARAL